MEIKWFGTATVVFSSGGKAILFDPFLPMNKSLPSPPIDELAAMGDIFITHGHFDHLIDLPRVAAAGERRIHCAEATSQVLLREGVEPARIVAIGPGDSVEKGPFTVRVFKGKHIKFNGKLILKTLFNRRIFTYSQNLRAIVKDLRRYPEGQVLVYLIEAEGKTVLHLGSLNLDPSEEYPAKVDLLSLPFQGRSDLNVYTLPYVSRFRPGQIYLHHFDDSFPPISSSVDLKPFLNAMEQDYPQINVIVPEYAEAVEV